MDPVSFQEKLRAERAAKEQARIQKLRQLNLKKYGKDESDKPDNKPRVDNGPKIDNRSKIDFRPKIENRPKPADSRPKIDNRPKTTQSLPEKTQKTNLTQTKNIPSRLTTNKPQNSSKIAYKFVPKATSIPAATASKIEPKNHNRNEPKEKAPIQIHARKSMIPSFQSTVPNKLNKPAPIRKSVAPEISTQNVFERLYKPKAVPSKKIDEVQALKTDPKFREQILKNSLLILNKRHTIFEPKKAPIVPVRRSISAVHFKRINKNELEKCNQKWSSIGSNLNELHLNEDERVKEDKLVSAVKSERKKVTFQRPSLFTPKADDLQNKLKSWLQKRGKSMDSYHHLQCFGIHHLPQETKLYHEENKENIAVESDSDNDSYHEAMNVKDDNNWRRASYVSSTELDETKETINSEDTQSHNELLVGALNDLAEMLREGFDWEQSARWLRAIRERFPWACDTAAYWECRAALEERQGNLPATVHCWEEAIAKGTETTVAEANLDQLLDKFMQLKISPTSNKQKPVSNKMLDLKNVFKSSFIRFAVQKAKLQQTTPAKYTVTPVRRSGRLSLSSRRAPRTPLIQLCSSMKQIDESIRPDTVFVKNNNLAFTP